MPAANVLIVEDDKVVRTLLNHLLRAHGYETCFAVDAYEALAVARREQPDAVILDYGLPGGDALTVIERLHRVASLATVPIIVVSARVSEPNAGLALAAGARCFLEKPFDPDELLHELEQALLGSGQVPADPDGRVFRPSDS